MSLTDEEKAYITEILRPVFKEFIEKISQMVAEWLADYFKEHPELLEESGEKSNSKKDS